MCVLLYQTYNKLDECIGTYFLLNFLFSSFISITGIQLYMPPPPHITKLQGCISFARLGNESHFFSDKLGRQGGMQTVISPRGLTF